MEGSAAWMETEGTEGIDIYFENLSLEVLANGNRSVVVDRVTGRIHRREMTALMGCSGAGKTSLLNALCGRGQYISYTVLP